VTVSDMRLSLLRDGMASSSFKKRTTRPVSTVSPRVLSQVRTESTNWTCHHIKKIDAIAAWVALGPRRNKYLYHPYFSQFRMRKQPLCYFWVAWSLLSSLVPELVFTTTTTTIELAIPLIDLSEGGKVDPMHGLPSFRLIFSLK
jgi:hypothetical protein